MRSTKINYYKLNCCLSNVKNLKEIMCKIDGLFHHAHFNLYLNVHQKEILQLRLQFWGMAFSVILSIELGVLWDKISKLSKFQA